MFYHLYLFSICGSNVNGSGRRFPVATKGFALHAVALNLCEHVYGTGGRNQ